MSLEALLNQLMSEQNEVVTPVTPVTSAGLQREPLQHKAVTPVTPQNSNELSRAKVLADLRAHPGITRAAEIDASGDPVTVMLAIRDVGTCVLEIDAERWSLEQFIALMDRQAGLELEVAA